MMRDAPCGWAGMLLHAILSPRDRDSVAGDLLEECHEIRSCRGTSAADRWYIRQVVGIAFRRQLFWAGAFAAIMAGRAALDAFVPTHEFSSRAAITTSAAAVAWLAAGFALTWRTTLLRSAVLGGLFTAALAGLVNYALMAALVGTLIATNNDVAWSGIQRSGGVGEMFVMPVLVLVAATMLATVGGTAARLVRWARG